MIAMNRIEGFFNMKIRFSPMNILEIIPMDALRTVCPTKRGVNGH